MRQPRFYSAILTLILLAASGQLLASDYSWNLHLASHHYHARSGGQDWNESNFGFGLQKELSSEEYIAFGYYKNSFYDNSFYVSYGREYGKDFKYGWVIGVVSGYGHEETPINFGGIQPIGGLTVSYSSFGIIINPWLIHLKINI